MVNQMGIGYNLGNTFNCCDNFIGDTFQNNQIKLFGTILPTKKIISKIKRYGFKTIRFQVKYIDLIFSSENLNSEWISKIKEIVDWIINKNIYCILSVHHDLEFWTSKEKNSPDKYINFWKQIAKEFIDYNDYLIFESMNEISYSYNSLLIYNQAFVDTIRYSGRFNKERLLIIPQIYTEVELNYYFEYKMPKDPANKFAVSINYFYPYDIFFEENNIKMTYYDRMGNLYGAIPIINWGSDYDYNSLELYYKNLTF